ncbi:hypothetical protein KM043_012307 [Ampulex compressa]|nr:hypothetical protein KM043_012307 [Ampulex compressa]
MSLDVRQTKTLAEQDFALERPSEIRIEFSEKEDPSDSRFAPDKSGGIRAEEDLEDGRRREVRDATGLSRGRDHEEEVGSPRRRPEEGSSMAPTERALGMDSPEDQTPFESCDASASSAGAPTSRDGANDREDEAREGPSLRDEAEGGRRKDKESSREDPPRDGLEKERRPAESARDAEKAIADSSAGRLEILARAVGGDPPKSEREAREGLARIAEAKRGMEDRKNRSLSELLVEFQLVPPAGGKVDAEETCDIFAGNFKVADDRLESDVRADDLRAKSTDSEEIWPRERNDRVADVVRAEEERRIASALERDVAEAAGQSEEGRGGRIIGRESGKAKERGDEKNGGSYGESAAAAEEVATWRGIVGGTSEETEVGDASSSPEDSPGPEVKREPERIHVAGKVYDFEEKRHGVRMTEELLRRHCKEHRLYQTPHLNDVLYLHYKGFSFIENLEKYTGLKSLWLESNGVREIANLENQTELRCLYLHHNLISKIENLERLEKLDTLILSHNAIRRIENLGERGVAKRISSELDLGASLLLSGSLKFLNTLNLSHNYLRETADIEQLRSLRALSVLDVSHNRIETEDVVEILGDMESLRVATLMGNPVVRRIGAYRKRMIVGCEGLRYLDDRPVFPQERACAEAWMRGGPEEERAERHRWIEADRRKIEESVTALINKRKLYKPVETSEKEPRGKKKTKTEAKKKEEEEEEEEEQQEEEDEDEDEEVAAKRLPCTSNQLLNLEKRKKSSALSFLDSTGSAPTTFSSSRSRSRSPSPSSASSSSSSSADEERRCEERTLEEVERRWKGDGESGGGGGGGVVAKVGPPPREERRGNESGPAGQKNRGLFMPWKPQTSEKIQLRKLIEDVSEVKRHDAENIDSDRRVRSPLASPASIGDLSDKYDPRGGPYNPAKEESVEFEEGERGRSSDSTSRSVPHPSENVQNAKGTWIDLGQEEEGGKKSIAKIEEKKEASRCRGGRLSGIRRDMRAFCLGMEKFERDNNIVFKDGNVQKFWGPRGEGEDPGEKLEADRESKSREDRGSVREEDTEKSDASLNLYESQTRSDCETIKMHAFANADFEYEKAKDGSLDIGAAFRSAKDAHRSQHSAGSGHANEKSDTNENEEEVDVTKFSDKISLLALAKESENSNASSVSDGAFDREPAMSLRDTTDEPSIRGSNIESLIQSTNFLSLEKGEDRSEGVDERNSVGKSVKGYAEKPNSVEGSNFGIGEEIDKRYFGRVLKRCKDRQMLEAKRFIRQKSPLIDKCIQSLMTFKKEDERWKYEECATYEFAAYTGPRTSSSSSESREALGVSTDVKSIVERGPGVRDTIDLQSVARFLKNSEGIDKRLPPKGKTGEEPYEKDLFDYLEEANEKKKLLTELNSVKTVQEISIEGNPCDLPETRAVSTIETLRQTERSATIVVTSEKTVDAGLGDYKKEPAGVPLGVPNAQSSSRRALSNDANIENGRRVDGCGDMADVAAQINVQHKFR